MRILLTGSTGMVGHNFLEHKSASSFDLLTPTLQELDLLNYPAVYRYLQKAHPDLIIHCAGYVGGIQANIKEPVRFLIDNLDMGRNLVLAARQTGVKRLLNLGSSCMYPRNAQNPLRETMVLTGELEPTNEGYALAKVVVDRLCQYISRETPDCQYKTLIPCNLYGRWDKFDPSHSHLIPAIIHKLHQAKGSNAPTVEIWGDGLARREFMYAGDFADCLVRACHNFETLPAQMNVGLGHDYSINEYYSIAAQVVGYGGHFSHDLSKPVGMKQKLVDTHQLSSWGWTSKTPLCEGISATYSFYLEHLKEASLAK